MNAGSQASLGCLCHNFKTHIGLSVDIMNLQRYYAHWWIGVL